MSLVEARDLFCVYPGAARRRRGAAGAHARRRRGRDLRRARPERLGEDDADARARRVRAAERRAASSSPGVELGSLSERRLGRLPGANARLRRPALLAGARGELTAEELVAVPLGLAGRSRARAPRARPRAARARRPARPGRCAAGRALRRRAAADRPLRRAGAPAAAADRRRADGRARRGERRGRLHAPRGALPRGGRDGARRQPRPALGGDRRPGRPHPRRPRQRGAERGGRGRRRRTRRLAADPRGRAARRRNLRPGDGDGSARASSSSVRWAALRESPLMLPDIEGTAGAVVELRGVTRRYGAGRRARQPSRRRSRRAGSRS